MNSSNKITNIIDQEIVFALPELPHDFKRMLRVQLKEFSHYLEEAGNKVINAPLIKKDFELNNLISQGVNLFKNWA